MLKVRESQGGVHMKRLPVVQGVLVRQEGPWKKKKEKIYHIILRTHTNIQMIYTDLRSSYSCPN